MVDQKEIIILESYDDELNRYKKSEYVVISRKRYNDLTKRSLACKIVYSNSVKPYLIPIKVKGLRGNSRVNTIKVYTLKQYDNSDSINKLVGKVSNKEFLQIAQAFYLNFNFPF